MLATDTVMGGRYQLEAIIGRGGGADVYRAIDQESGRPVAVKVLRSATPSDLKRFALEAHTLGRLDHPAIVRMCDQGEQDGVPYLVLDLIDGEPLSSRLERGPLDEDEVMRIGAVLADALAHAHAFGVVHRDVKPGNVLFDRNGAVHLTDFGVARLTDVTAITSTGFVIGTPAYLAPEQISGDGAGPAADVYALGLVLIEALTGAREYGGSPSEAAIARLHREPVIPRTMDASFARLLASMTKTDPASRPSAASAASVLQTSGDQPRDATTVLPIASDATVAIPLPVAAPPSAARRRLLPILVAIIAVITILVGLASRGGDDNFVPASADPSTTVTTAAPTTTTTPPTTTTAPPHRGKGKKGD